MLKNFIGGALLLMLGACVQAPVSQTANLVGSNDAVAKMAAGRWSMLLEGRIDDAYESYVSPATKAFLSRDAYRGSIKPGLWKSASVKNIDCSSEDLCAVNVLVGYAYKGKAGVAVENDTVLDETWRKIDGRWWFVPRQ